MQYFKQLLADLKQHRPLLILALLCILVEALADLSVAAVLRTGVDAITGGSYQDLLAVGIWFTVITVVMTGVVL